MFRNLTVFRFPKSWGGLFGGSVSATLDATLASSLAQHPLKPVGPLEMTSHGWVSPYGRCSEVLVQSLGSCSGIAAGSQEKILPPAVVDELLAKKLDEFEEQTGHRLGGKARKLLKGTILQELLPKAFVKPGRTDAYIDFDRNLIAIDTSSRKVAEDVVSLVRQASGSFPALPLHPEVSPRAVLTGWLAGGGLPEKFVVGDECELRAADSDGAVVKIQRSDLASDEVTKHLEAGMQCTRLALVYGDAVSFVIDESLVLRKVKFLDAAMDTLEGDDRDSLEAELDARFALQTGLLGRLFDALAGIFKLGAEDDAPDGPAPRAAHASSADGQDTVTISTVVDGKEVELASMTTAELKQLGQRARRQRRAQAVA